VIERIRSAAKQTFYYGIGNIAVKLIGFILLPVYARNFSIEVYGLLALFEILADVIIATSSLGIENGFNRWYWDNEGKDRQKSLFFTTLLFSIISTFICLLIGFFLIDMYSLQIFDIAVSTSVIGIFLINILLRVIVLRVIYLMQIKQQVMRQTRYVLINLGTVLITTVFFIMQLNMSIEGVFLGQICGNMLVFLLLIPYLSREIKLVIELQLLKKMIRYSLPLAISALFALVMTLSDRFILKHYYSLSDVGQYSLAYKVASLIKLLIVRSFMRTYNIKYYNEINNEKHDHFFDKSITYFTFIAIYSGILLSIISKTVIKFLTANADYYDSLHIVPYLVASAILFGMRSMLFMPMAKMKKSYLISLIAIGAGVMNLILNFLVIPRLGSLGAALTTAASQAVAVLVCLAINKKYGYSNYEVVKYLKAFLVGIGLIYIWLVIPEWQVILRMITDVIILILYPVLLYLLGFFEKHEIKRARQSLAKWSKPENIIRLFKKEIGGE
jgi:O-antigen/teichoic acid export membrane protein